MKWAVLIRRKNKASSGWCYDAAHNARQDCLAEINGNRGQNKKVKGDQQNASIEKISEPKQAKSD